MNIETNTSTTYKVIKRNGMVAPFDIEKIKVAIGKAFLAVEGSEVANSSRVHDRISELTTMVLEVFTRRLKENSTIHIEEIQDQVELALMRTGEQKVARAYVIYREQQAAKRNSKEAHPSLQVKDKTGKLVPLDLTKVKAIVENASTGLEGINVDAIVEETVKNLYNGVEESAIVTTMMMATRTRIEQEPNYSFVTARLLRDELVATGLEFLGLPQDTKEADALEPFLKKGVELEILSPVLLEKFDLKKLAAAIVPERSNQFTYLGLQTLFDRYFIHCDNVRYELPQLFFMRVAMGLSINEEQPNERAIEFYDLLSKFDYMASTPTLFNAGTLRPQLSSCYLTTIDDDLYSIYDAMRDNAMLSKWAGGLGNDWTPVRALNSYIKGTNGKSQGVVPFLKVANDTAVAVNQCFAPNTSVYVKGGVKAIKDIQIGDLVLGVSGTYREVTNVMEYDQHDPMVEVLTKHANVREYDQHDAMVEVLTKHAKEPVQVTAGHPFRVMNAAGDVQWIGAGKLTTTDLVEQVIPTEIVMDGDKRHLPLEATKELIRNWPISQELIIDGTRIRLALNDNSDELAYQLLRLGVLVSYEANHMVIPTVAVMHEILDDLEEVVEPDWVIKGNKLYSPVVSVNEIEHCPVVYDLIVEGDESYMLTSGLAHNGGKRKGAICAYLETWHLDIEEFLELRKNTGDDRRRTHDMNTANWIPDLFMIRLLQDGNWTLFTPSETPDLHDLTGLAFQERYEYYESVAKEKGMLHKVVAAKDLWRKMLSMLFETGHPWFTYKDPCNIRSPQQHVGVVHSSNLCTEITLNTSKDEIAVCNLGSINLVQHVNDGKLDVEKLKKTVKTAVRILDNVIDINYYAVPQARNSNLKHRPVGMGIMGFQDSLYKLGIAYGSNEAVEFADYSMEVISYEAIKASSGLAVERGTYETFEGSLWSKGILPIDSIELLAQSRPAGMLEQDRSTKLGEEAWDKLRRMVVTQGMRNSNVMAIAPTATISNICGVSQSIEPTFQNLYVKSNLSGEFTVINPYLVNALKERGLWDSVMVNDLKHFEGSVQKIARIPEELKAIYATAFEVEARWIVDAASRRQKWIDQAQSLNLYIAGADGKKLDITYKMTWLRGLKTTYYLRAMGATSTEKSTINTGALNAVKPVVAAPVADEAFSKAAPVPAACSIDNPECEACQ